jgi:hypothetical protein
VTATRALVAAPLMVVLAGAVGAALGACSSEPTRFPVVITAVSDDGRPMPDVPITLGKAPAGKTDAEGHLRIRVAGSEGMKVAVMPAIPKGYKLASAASPLVLRRLTDIEGGAEHLLPVEYTIKLAPLVREYAILVRAGVPGLPVETFGTQQATTNSRGVAMFVYRGSPGDELQVKIGTDGHPELRPQNPTQSFLLAQRAEAYVVKEHFGVVKGPKKRVPKHIGPRRL